MKEASAFDRVGAISASDLKEIVDAIPSALFVKDAQCRVLLMNRRCEEQWGLTFADIAGTDGSSLFPKEQMEGFLKADQQVFRDGMPINFEESLWNARLQTNQYVHTTKSPTYHADGSPRFLIGVSIDIEKSKYFEARLHESQQTLRTLYELSPLGIARTDMQGKFIEFNKAFERICGYTREELLEIDYWKLTPTSYQEQEAHQLEMLRVNGYYGPYEKEYVQKDGSRIPIRLNGVLTTDANGEKFIWSIIEDITEHKRSEAELLESSERFSSLVNSIPQLVWTATKDGQLLFANEKLYEFVGTDVGDLSGLRKGMLDMLSPASAKTFKLAWRLANQEQKPEFNLEVQALRFDGEYRWLELHAVSNPSTLGHQTHWIGTLTDVSERRAADHAMRESQKLEAIGSLTGGLAHDFNNLLGIVLGNLDMLNASPLGDRAAAQVRVALAAAERGAELTKSLLAVARGQSSVATETSLISLLEKMKPLLVHTVGVRISLQLKIELEQALALVDLAGFESSMLNLVINARDAMAGKGILSIVLRAPTKLEVTGLPPGRYAVIEVRDTGCGMHADVLSKATNPFFTTKERGRGTGLGLAMVSGFAHQSGGRLHIESKVGHGTEVRLTIPLILDGQLESRPAELQANVQSTRRGTILVVDDEQPLLDLLSEWLVQAGYDVQCSNSAENAWKLMQKAAPDILITDVVMPGKFDGLGLAARVEKLGTRTQILLVSGFPIAGEEAVAASKWPMLAKPYRRAELIARVESLVKIQKE